MNLINPVLTHKEQIAQSYDKVFQYINGQVSYYGKYRNYALWAKTLRYTSLILLGIGSTFPLLELFIVKNGNNQNQLFSYLGQYNISNLGFLFIAVAGGMTILERIAGISSTYSRYVSVFVKLTIIVTDFELEFNNLIVGINFKDATSDIDDIRAEKIMNFFISYKNLVDKMVEEETETWKTQFKDAGDVVSEMVHNAYKEHKQKILDDKEGIDEKSKAILNEKEEEGKNRFVEIKIKNFLPEQRIEYKYGPIDNGLEIKGTIRFPEDSIILTRLRRLNYLMQVAVFNEGTAKPIGIKKITFDLRAKESEVKEILF